jgi:GT2 family glycosyltransferase
VNWRVTYFPDAVIYHLIGKSTDLAPTRMTYEFHRSQHLFYKKHYAASTPLLLRMIIPIGIWMRAIGKMARYRIRRLQRAITGADRNRRNRTKKRSW